MPTSYFSVNLMTGYLDCKNLACMWCHFRQPGTLRNASYSVPMLAPTIFICKASHLWGVTTSEDYCCDPGLWRTHSFLSRSCTRTFGPCQRISWGSDGGMESQQCCCSSEWRKVFRQICSNKWCLIGPRSRSLSYIFRFDRCRVALDHKHKSRIC